MIPLFQNDNILNINIIALQEPWKNTQNQTTYHPQKDSFYLLYPESDKARVCFFINKKIDQSIWTYTTDGADIISLHLNLPDRYIHIHNLYNPVKAEETSTSIPILKRRLAAYPNEEHIVLGDFNLYHKAWGGPGASTTLIEKSEKLLIVTQRWEMEQIVLVGTATYKKSTRESTIDLVFTMSFLTKSLIACGIAGDFDHDSDHQPILSKWTMRNVDNLLSPGLLLSKMDISTFEKTLTEELANDTSRISTIPYELDIKVHFLINAINITMTLAIPKARLSPKSIPGFDEKCKKIQMKLRRLKEVWKKEGTEESWENFQIARAVKGRVIVKAKRKAYCKLREEACASPKSM